MPYSSAVVLVETLEEILTDKIRALYERQYLKGRDIFDLWWIVVQLKTAVNWRMLEDKLSMYRAPFHPARSVDYFQRSESLPEIESALRSEALPAADELEWGAVDCDTLRQMAKPFPLSVSRRLQVLLDRP